MTISISSTRLVLQDNVSEILPEKHLKRSPLWYPGGKGRVARLLASFIPKETKEVISPFFGGGGFELVLDQVGIKVFGYDAYPILVDFWQATIEDASKVANGAEGYLGLTVPTFKQLQKAKYSTILQRAIQFFVVNRASFSGRGFSGSMAKKQKGFTQSCVDYLRDFTTNKLTVEYQDFRDTIRNNTQEIFMYLDPPYAIGKNSQYYGKEGNLHEDFPHEELRDLLKNRDWWMMSYNNSDEIKEMYQEYKMIEPEWYYGMFPGTEKARELLIFSKNLSDLLVEG